MLYFEDVELGQEVTFEAVYHVTEEEIIEVGNRWDPQPFHVDPEAARESIFGGLVASSAHVFAIWVSMGNDDIDKDKAIASVSALGFNNLQWHAPIRPGDAIQSSFKVTEVAPGTRHRQERQSHVQPDGRDGLHPGVRLPGPEAPGVMKRASSYCQVTTICRVM